MINLWFLVRLSIDFFYFHNLRLTLAHIISASSVSINCYCRFSFCYDIFVQHSFICSGKINISCKKINSLRKIHKIFWLLYVIFLHSLWFCFYMLNHQIFVPVYLFLSQVISYIKISQYLLPPGIPQALLIRWKIL